MDRRSMTGITARNKSIRIVIDHDKKRYSKTLKIPPTPANIKYAIRQRTAWIHELEKGLIPSEFGIKKETHISALLDRWIDAKQKQVKSSTLNDYIKSVRILTVEFGKINAEDLTIGMIRDLCNESDATAKRLNNLLSPLRQALQEAVEDAIIDKNILNGWSYKKPRIKTDETIDPFTKDEQIAILGSLDGQAKNLIQFALWTGLRTSEYIALEWGDIDFIAGTVKISRAFTQAANKAESPKTISGNRTIKLLGPALDALTNQKKHTFLLNGIVFNNPRTDQPWEGDAPIRKTLWIPALKKAGVRYRKPYHTRHTYASMMLSSGESPMWVATQMGHANWTMIGKVYGKWMPDAIPDAGQKAEAIFGGSVLGSFGGVS